jgi:hypothetical protein
MNQFIYWLKARKQKSGLLPTKLDPRDLEIDAVLGGWFGGYSPKNESKRLTPTFTKNQKGNSNCSFQSWSNSIAIAYAQAIGVATGENISSRWIVAKAYQQGLCGVDGWADIRSGAKIAQKFGFCTEQELPSDETLSWREYVNIDFKKYDALASKRKIGSYYKINNIDDYLRAIDAGHAVVLGRTWMSGMNQGGGFSAPWVLPRKGYSVGGHATCGVGYNLRYQGLKVSDELNSYGSEWGDNGHFYCPLTDLAKDISQFGAYAITDLIYSPKITAEKIISEYEGKNVRGDKSGAIFLIYDGKKYPYKNAEAFVAVNGFPYSAKGAYILVPQQAIDGVSLSRDTWEDSILNGSNGKYAEIVALMKKPINNNFNDGIEVKQ